MKKILIAFVIIVVAVGGYLALQYRHIDQPAPVPTSGWKTYTNAQYSYSLRYPTTWKTGDCSVASARNCQGLSAPSGSGFAMSIKENKYASIDAVRAAFQPSAKTYTQKQVMLGSASWWKISTTTPSLAGDLSATFYWTSRGSDTYFVVGADDTTRVQILSTFTFTPKATTSCIPRPACLDATPRCLPPEPLNGWCK